MNIKSAGAIALGIFALATSAAQAAGTVTANMGVQITIQNACAFTTAPTTLQFGTQGPLIANVDVTTTFAVTCTTGDVYNIAMSAGSGTVAARTMLNGATPVNYSLFYDSGRTKNWGVTSGTDTLAGTGNGTSQTITVYGRVPPQTTPAAAVYNDTVQVSVNY